MYNTNLQVLYARLCLQLLYPTAHCRCQSCRGIVSPRQHYDGLCTSLRRTDLQLAPTNYRPVQRFPVTDFLQNRNIALSRLIQGYTTPKDSRCLVYDQTTSQNVGLLFNLARPVDKSVENLWITLPLGLTVR